MSGKLTLVHRKSERAPVTSLCQHRTVSKDGRIVCLKIIEGDNRVSPKLCRVCPYKVVNCAHLRFSLRQTSPSPLIVRFHGRTEIWDDDQPAIRFHQAGCATRIMPIDHPRFCAGCAEREPTCEGEIPESQSVEDALERGRSASHGKVVPFPQASVESASV